MQEYRWQVFHISRQTNHWRSTICAQGELLRETEFLRFYSFQQKLYFVGHFLKNDLATSFVYCSEDFGIHWVKIDEFCYEDTDTFALDIVADDDSVAMIGIAQMESHCIWFVRENRNSEGWKTTLIDQVTDEPELQSSCITKNDQTLIVAGDQEIEENCFWKIHSQKGNLWIDKKINFLAEYFSTNCWKAFVDSNNNFFILGEAYSELQYHWLVSKNYHICDSFSPYEDKMGSGASARAIAEDSKGSLYVVGEANDGSKFSWLVRKSEDSGSTWKSIDSFSSFLDCSARAIYINKKDEVFVAGRQFQNNLFQIIIRKSEDFGANWKTIQSYDCDKDQFVDICGICEADFGDLIVACYLSLND